MTISQENKNSPAMAYIEHHKGGDNLNWERVDHPYAKATPLYAEVKQSIDCRLCCDYEVCNQFPEQSARCLDGDLFAPSHPVTMFRKS